MNINAYEGQFEAPEGRLLILVSRFNHMVVDSLLAGTLNTLERNGVTGANIDVVKAPGAFELPIICQQVLRARPYVGVIALGAVIRGETGHYDTVAGGAHQGLMNVSLSENVPITFGILTCENIEQAIARSGMTVGNKGSEAAQTLIETLSVLRKIND